MLHVGIVIDAHVILTIGLSPPETQIASTFSIAMAPMIPVPPIGGCSSSSLSACNSPIVMQISLLVEK
jgi:hypothetical protein